MSALDGVAVGKVQYLSGGVMEAARGADGRLSHG